MHVTLTFIAEDRAELDQIMDFFGRYFGERAVLNSLEGLGQPITLHGATPVTDAVDAEASKPTKRRGRPRKDTTNVVDLAETTEAEPELFTQPNTLADAASLDDMLNALPPDSSVPPAEPKNNKATDATGLGMTPEEQRVKGRQLLLELVQRDGTKASAVKKLVSKYKVTQFLEIPDERSGEFLADALMVANATEA